MASPSPPVDTNDRSLVAQPETIDVDTRDDQDSAFESFLRVGQDSTASITTSILRYRQENGRTYHAYKDGKYVIPNDAAENERLDLQHHLFLLTFNNNLYLSPAGRDGHQLRHVLDVGTGTGLWATDFADEHPDTSVIGVDLSPTQSPFIPPNVSFQIDDLEDNWTFNTKFDFIYSRMMTAAFADWPKFFKQAYDNLNPGGWIELCDICPVTSDDGTTKDTHLSTWVTELLDGTRKIGRPFDGAFEYKKQLEAQGFQNVTQRVFKWPQNTWPKDPKFKELGKKPPFGALLSQAVSLCINLGLVYVD